MTRRDWLLLGGMGVIGGCAPFGGGRAKAWTSGRLEEVDAVIRREGCRGWAAWEGGALVKSWRTHARGPALSITKALAGLACARAAGEGWVGMEERVADTIHEWRGRGEREFITVGMLVRMTAGLEEGADRLYRRSVADKGGVAISLPLVAMPGTAFRYGPACWEVLAELLHRKAAARGGTLEEFVGRAVMRPVGLSRSGWRSDGRGRIYLSTGAELSVTELGRLGRTIAALLSGRDAAGITSRAYREVTEPSRANPMFGGGVWGNRRAARGRPVEVEEVLDEPRGSGFWSGACLSREQPASMVALIGSSGQRVFVWPEENRVVARLGYSGEWRDGPLMRVV